MLGHYELVELTELYAGLTGLIGRLTGEYDAENTESRKLTSDRFLQAWAADPPVSFGVPGGLRLGRRSLSQTPPIPPAQLADFGGYLFSDFDDTVRPDLRDPEGSVSDSFCPPPVRRRPYPGSRPMPCLHFVSKVTARGFAEYLAATTAYRACMQIYLHMHMCTSVCYYVYMN